MENNNPIEFLKREHHEALQKLTSLEEIIDTLRHLPGKDKLTHLRETEIDLIKLIFPLEKEIGLHFKKEEEALFPILSEYIGKENGSIEVMIHEHREIRVAFHKLNRALFDLLESTQMDLGRLLKSIVGYGDSAIGLFLKHITKENQILFEICEATLSEDEKRSIAEKMKKIDLSHAE